MSVDLNELEHWLSPDADEPARTADEQSTCDMFLKLVMLARAAIEMRKYADAIDYRVDAGFWEALHDFDTAAQGIKS